MEGLEGGVEGGPAGGEGGLKQRAANHPGDIPSPGNQGHWERVLEASNLLPLSNGALPQGASLSPHLQVSRCWGLLPNTTVFWKPLLEKAGTLVRVVPDSGHYSTAERNSREWPKLACYSARGCPYGMVAARVEQVLFIRMGVGEGAL